MCKVPSLIQKVEADKRQISHNERPRRFGVDAGEQIRARAATDDAGNRNAGKQFPVHILVQDMANARCAGRKHLNEMDTSRCAGGGDAHHADEQRAANHAKGHAKRAIDQLCCKANGDVRRNRRPIDIGNIFNHPNLALTGAMTHKA